VVNPRVVIVGATGAVGQVAIDILQQRAFPMESLRLCASHRSYGKLIQVGEKEIPIEAPTAEVFAECDIAFISASAEVSRTLAPLAVTNGCTVIDDSSAFRMDPQVPLVVPEINENDIEFHTGILSIPNCSTTQMVMSLYPLHRHIPLERVVVDTYQSVSGTGRGAQSELMEQSKNITAGIDPVIEQYPYQIAFNVLPHIESFDESGYTREEIKMREETQKIMHCPELKISATCVRVPVSVGHSESVHAEFKGPMSPETARSLLSNFPGVAIVDDPTKNAYPMPLMAHGRDEVFVGRIRQDVSVPNGLAMWIVSDNLRKGAATNAIQIAECLLERGALLR
jgi:aspartate-semialdehyde dehydrogenase